MQDEVTVYKRRAASLQQQIQFLIEQEKNLAILIGQNRHLEATFEDKWKAIQHYVSNILMNKYRYYISGVPTLEHCVIRLEVQPCTIREISEGYTSPIHKWILDGPAEEVGAKHRRMFDITQSDTYCCARPDQLLCAWLSEKEYIFQYIVD